MLCIWCCDLVGARRAARRRGSAEATDPFSSPFWLDPSDLQPFSYTQDLVGPLGPRTLLLSYCTWLDPLDLEP